MTTTATALIEALQACQGAPADMPSQRVVGLAAKMHGVEPAALTDLWLTKMLAVALARAEIARERSGDA